MSNLKIIVFVSCLMSCWIVYAQTKDSILYYEGRSLGTDPEQVSHKTKEIIEAVKSVMTDTVFEEIEKQSPQGQKFSVLQIVPIKTGSTLNQEAYRVFEQMHGLKLIFSPYELSRPLGGSASAIFDPSGDMIGVSYKFVLGEDSDASYLHELYHAQNQNDVVQGRKNFWVGVMKSEGLSVISKDNSQGYSRFASLDELLVTSFSIKLAAQEILNLKSNLSEEIFFHEFKSPAQNVLDQLNFYIDGAYALSKQYIDVVHRSLDKLHSYQKKYEDLSIGDRTSSVVSTLFKLDSYTYEFQNGGKKVDIYIPNGVEFKMYWPTDYTENELEARLEWILNKSLKAKDELLALKACIAEKIVSTDLKRSDYDCIRKNSANPYNALK